MRKTVCNLSNIVSMAFLTVLPACSSPHIKSARNPAELSAPPFHKVMVAGMDERAEFRIGFENDAVRYLSEHGVDAIASHKQYSFNEMNVAKGQVLPRLKAAGAESVLLVRITDRNDVVDWTPADLEVSDMEEVDELQYRAFTDPGGMVKTDLNIGAKLYRASDGALVWNGVVAAVVKESTDPVVLVRQTAKLIVDRMARDKVVP